MDIIPLVTFGVAVLGAGLGIINTWNAISQRKLRLRVTPAHLITPQGLAFSIETINLSTFPVTVAEAGFTFAGPKKQRFVLANPMFLDGGTWPRRLGSRESFTIVVDPRDMIHAREKIAKAYIRTACGEVILGNSPALQQVAAGA